MKIVALARSAILNPLAAITAAGLFAAILGILAGGGASTDTAATNGIDCRTITATPTVSPTPTPSPPWVPSSSQLICNDTNQNVNDLHIIINREIETLSPGSFAIDGCPSPTWVYEAGVPPGGSNIAVFWAAPCVDPGEYTFANLRANCTTPEPGCSIPGVVCAYWTYNAVIVTPQATAINPPVCASPAYTATPVPTAGPIGGSVQLLSSNDSGGRLNAIWLAVVASILAFGAAFIVGYRRALPH